VFLRERGGASRGLFGTALDTAFFKFVPHIYEFKGEVKNARNRAGPRSIGRRGFRGFEPGPCESAKNF
jgi:hypothetical protein